MVNAGTFDYAADGWGYTYGAAAEWYQGRFALRASVFDLSETPTGGTAPNGLNLDPTFSQFQLVGEIEERHELEGPYLYLSKQRIRPRRAGATEFRREAGISVGDLSVQNAN